PTHPHTHPHHTHTTPHTPHTTHTDSHTQTHTHTHTHTHTTVDRPVAQTHRHCPLPPKNTCTPIWTHPLHPKNMHASMRQTRTQRIKLKTLCWCSPFTV